MRELTTAGINAAMQQNAKFQSKVLESITKFKKKEWGDCEPEDKALNDDDPSSAMGVYKLDEEVNSMMKSEDRIWIKCDDYGPEEGLVLTVLFPSEY